MGSETSEQVMALLKEIAVLKELDKAYESNPTEAEHEAYRVRQQRHEEVTVRNQGSCEAKQGNRT